ncbi:hypothetical protein ACIQXG_06125 [Lysinibacillus sphaericus]|uniref:hypothetical protein n=1 Tax=Lysinibacillus sphaericus TaxID=1421 RepID=UPI00382D329E
MINITKRAEPRYLTNQNSDTKGERARIIKYMEIDNKTWADLKNVFSFNVYSNRAVKNQLKIEFYSKCAFCESLFMQNSYGEVEHWRPKQGVKGNPNHKGYYWLASDWDNLLWACRVCNSTKYKGTHFPLKDIAKRSFKSTHKLSEEEPMLLNPCNPNIKVEDHLYYKSNGMIVDKTSKGKTSIELYGLMRADLQAERQRHAFELSRIFEQICIAYEDLIFYMECSTQTKSVDFTKKIDHRIDKKKSLIDRLIKQIIERIAIDKEFVGMNRQLVKVHISKLSSNKLLFKLLTTQIKL